MEEKKTIENLKDLLDLMQADETKDQLLGSAVPAAPVQIPDIPYTDFTKADIRVGVIKSAERIPKKDRLLKLEVDLGPLGMRTIVAGIAEAYDPAKLMPHLVPVPNDPGYEMQVPGTSILVVTNLEPRKVGGVLSHGMLLAGKDEQGNLSLATCPKMPAGTQIG